MEPKAKPTPKQGERNIYCPFYSDCLDYVVKHFWQRWSCSECPYKLIKQSITEWEYIVNDTNTHYDLPSNGVRRIGKNESDI